MAHLSINCKSKALGMPVMLDVLMPQGRGGYKTLYLLHGLGGDHTSWLLKSRIADYVEKTNIAVIMPSGNNRFYVDNVNGKAYFTFVTEELPNMCENVLAVSRESKDRFIAGMSMGGYGAFYAALKCPGRYGAAFSYSGSLDIGRMYDNYKGVDFYPVFGSRQQLQDGDFDLFRLAESINHNPVDNSTKFVMSCGLQDSLADANECFYEHMKKCGFDVEYSCEDGGHNWDYWDGQIKKTIEIISKM